MQQLATDAHPGTQHVDAGGLDVVHRLGDVLGDLDRSRTSAGNLCTINNAKAVVEPAPGGNSAGHIGLQVTVTNSGSAACVDRGLPRRLPRHRDPGPAARRAGQAHDGHTGGDHPRAGRQGQRAAPLAQAANFPDCGVTPAMGFRIYLPDDTAAQFSPQTQQGCSNAAVVLMEIGPFAR